MIVGERKPLEEIFRMVEPFQKICLLGCGTCVTVCLAGGDKEVAETAAAISLYRKKSGKPVEIVTKTLLRQCEYEYVDEYLKDMPEVDAVVSMACGAGVQLLAERLPEKMVLPALNTKFIGYPLEQGVWMENCLACGNCVLDLTGGICPIARCSKSMLNGPCGGSQDGKCEIDKNIDCAWHLIYERLQRLGLQARMDEIQPPKDWSTSHSGGPRKIVREDVRLNG
ncbi:MAG: hypothetical protein GX767_02380 [Firmicutes bacterium]|nr:hypothetical protein [Bacillota bacterium]